MSRIGKWRHQIAIQSLARAARTATGSEVESWGTDATRWGSVEPLAGKETISGEKVQGEATHKIVMRYYAGMKSEFRLVHNSRNFEITSIVNVMEKEKLHVILAKELIQ